MFLCVIENYVFFAKNALLITIFFDRIDSVSVSDSDTLFFLGLITEPNTFLAKHLNYIYDYYYLVNILFWKLDIFLKLSKMIL